MTGPMRTSQALTFQKIPQIDGPLAGWMRSVYDASFPPAERDDFDDLCWALEQGASELYLARSAGQPAGFALTVALPGLDTAVLGYLAVDATQRNTGVGGHLLEHVAQVWRARAGITGLLIEVESTAHGSFEERSLRRRRLGFYQRHGAIPLRGVSVYRIPDLSGPGAVDMQLLWLPLQLGGGQPNLERVRRYVHALYELGYGLPPDHPLLLECLAGLTATSEADTIP